MAMKWIKTVIARCRVVSGMHTIEPVFEAEPFEAMHAIEAVHMHTCWSIN